MSKYEIGQEIPVGGVITITGIARNKNGNPVYNTDRGVVVPELLIERLEMKPLEKVQPEQPKQEPVKLYCVKDHAGWFTKGKVYELIPGKGIKYDHGEFLGDTYGGDWKRYAELNKTLAPCLVPLVSRPAEVGEWVYIWQTSYCNDWRTGDLAQVITVSKSGNAHIAKNTDAHPKGLCYLEHEYLVLDGYKPEPEKAEPECLNMRVVCVDDGNCSCCWIVGAPYKVINGEIRDKDGERMLNNVTSLDDLNSRLSGKFIEFKGE